VAESESYSKAARQLFMNQPNVYVQMRALEKEHHCRLFDQVGKRAVLTEAGRTLYTYANQILALEHDAVLAMRDLGGLSTGRLSVGGGTIVGNYLLPRIMAEFGERYPNIDLGLKIWGPPDDVAKDLNDFSVDLGFCVDSGQFPNTVVVEAFYEDPILLCVGANHPLAAQSAPSAADLAGERFVWFGPGTHTQAAGRSALRDLGLEPRDTMVLGSPEAVKTIVKEGYGVTLLPQLAIDEDLRAGRLRVITPPGFRASLSICCLRHGARHLSPSAGVFLELAREWAAQMARPHASLGATI